MTIKKLLTHNPNTFTTTDLNVLLQHLGDTDPQIRDNLLFNQFAKWAINHEFSNDQLLYITKEILVTKINSENTLTRSFAALWLAVILDTHKSAPFLPNELLTQIVQTAPKVLLAELDQRGFDSELGWVHAFAHEADYVATSIEYWKETTLDKKEILAIFPHIIQLSDRFTANEEGRLAAIILFGIREKLFTLTELIHVVHPYLTDNLTPDQYMNTSNLLIKTIALLHVEKVLSDSEIAPLIQLYENFYNNYGYL